MNIAIFEISNFTNNFSQSNLTLFTSWAVLSFIMCYFIRKYIIYKKSKFSKKHDSCQEDMVASCSS
jgi:uncharacterized membrane protein YobD (UPF0266 family)